MSLRRCQYFHVCISGPESNQFKKSNDADWLGDIQTRNFPKKNPTGFAVALIQLPPLPPL
jgi:hypothetical protein